jgi:hypothetical protein
MASAASACIDIKNVETISDPTRIITKAKIDLF